MVRRSARAASAGKRRPAALKKKLWRDMRASAMQFLAVVALCALGTWVYAGLDGGWRMIQASYDAYFDKCSLADLWVNTSALSKADVDNLANLPGVFAVQARFTAEMDAPDQGEDVSLRVHAYDGDPAINAPYLMQGALLKSGDRRGILLEKQFADAYGLTEGSSITLRLAGRDMTFFVRGLVISAEEMMLAKDVSPDPAHYSFAIVSAEALPAAPFNEALIRVSDGADAAAERSVQALLPESLLLDCHTQASMQRAETMVTIFRTLSYVFPAMAFAVAAMVVLSTLTRMIENQRIQMGALKALGYRDRRIRLHYMNYALVPSLFGAALGLFTGRYTLPDILYNMETAHYIMPDKIRAPISLSAWCVTGLMVVLSLLICLYTYHSAAKETTAQLLRPKPPKDGSRVALERFRRLWAGFSFNTKMMIRNIARNKGRTMMSMIGLLCCNMLIVCAMGLQNSIDASIEQYYGGVLRYDVRAVIEDGGTLCSYQNRLDAAKIEGVMEKSVSLRNGDTSRTTVLNVLTDGQTLLHLGEKQTLVPLPKDGVMLTSKLAEVLSLDIGDTAELWLPGEKEPIHLTVCAIAPVSMGQAAYLSESVWDELRKGDFAPTALLIDAPGAQCIESLQSDDAVTELRYTSDQMDAALDMMDSTKAVFSVMYLAAIGLAFVICYNMSLMNFTERMRDYATLKVLGYHQKEIRSLMMRENDIVSVAGTLLGIGPGLLLTRVVLSTVTSETMVWTAQVAPVSILIASGITASFSVLLELLVTRKVPGIDMVEALKSVE